MQLTSVLPKAWASAKRRRRELFLNEMDQVVPC